MLNKSRIKKIKIRNGRNTLFFTAEILYKPLESIAKGDLEKVVQEIRRLVADNWGDFGEDFVRSHVLESDFFVSLRNEDGALVGLATISKKIILEREIYYFELTVIDKKYESLRLSARLNYLLMSDIIFRDILRGKFRWEFMLITPNMKVLGSLAHLATFIYPDPYKFDLKTKKIPLADNETWEMTEFLIRHSDEPSRPISREGNVLSDSYRDLPDLIYKPGKAPIYRDRIVNEFGETYLEYSKASGKELVVRVKFGLGSLLKLFTNLIKK